MLLYFRACTIYLEGERENEFDRGPGNINQKAYDEACLSMIQKDPSGFLVGDIRENDVEWIMKRGFHIQGLHRRQAG